MNHFELWGASSLRGRSAAPHRRGGRHAGLCLFLGHPGAALHGPARRAAGAGLKDPLIAFAVKANPNVAVLRTLGDLGAGADTVSEGEIRRALAAGIPPSASSSPASARPRPRSPSPLEPASPRSTSSPSRAAPGQPRGPALGQRADVAIRVNPDVRPAATPRSPPARPRTSSASRSPRPSGSTPTPPTWPASARSASPATSAARSPTWPPGGRLRKMRGLVERLRGEGLPSSASTSAAAWACPTSTSRPRRARRLRRHDRRA
jgi:hypothetical protein